MWNTFKYTLLALVKERNILIWALAFPLIMATLFNIMFSGIDESSEFKVIPIAVIDDENFREAEAFKGMIEDLSQQDSDQLLDVRLVPSTEEARRLLSEGGITGYYHIDENFNPSLFVANANELDSTSTINQTILKSIADNFVRSRSTLESLVAKNPQSLTDPIVLKTLSQVENYTEAISVIANPASGSVRYFYALLGFASIMGANVGMVAITRTQANLSTLGARRSVGSTSRIQVLTSTLLASWLISFLCLFFAFCYMRFVLDIGFGGRDLASILGLAVASLMTTSLGAFIGSIPKLGEGSKAGILTGLSCLFALFAGLYGASSQRLSDDLAQSIPLLQLVNPAKQVADLFYSLYFYDSYEPFFTTVGVLLIITAVLFLIAAIFMRRQRYASI